MHRNRLRTRTISTAVRLASAASLTAVAACAHGRAPARTPAVVASRPPHPAPTPLPVPAPRPFNPQAALTRADARWIDSTLATLSLRQRIGQTVMVWVLGDYTSYGDSSYAEVRRWIERLVVVTVVVEVTVFQLLILIWYLPLLFFLIT